MGDRAPSLTRRAEEAERLVRQYREFVQRLQAVAANGSARSGAWTYIKRELADFREGSDG